MQIEDIKRWQWAILGLLAGLAFAYAWQDHDVTGDKTYEMAEIKQLVFERDALAKSNKSGQPILQDVRVEPPVQDYQGYMRQIVTGKRLRLSKVDQHEYLVPFYYYAAAPYEARILPPGVPPLAKDATVMTFLAVAQKANPILHFRFAWEMESKASMALWATGGLVLIGGVWPTVLNLLLGAGLGRPPKTEEEKANEEYLKRFGKRKQKAKAVLAAKGPTDADFAQLDQMNKSLESELGTAGVFATAAPPTAADSAAAAPAVATLNATPASGEAAQKPEMERREGETEEEFRKRFSAGDFYPVSRGAKKK
jgi:hypothetical protein